MKHIYLTLLAATLSLCVSAQNVELVADINTSVTNEYNSYPYGFTQFQGKLYFTPSGDNMPNRYEMWVYDYVNPPYMAFDLDQGSGESQPMEYYVFNNKLYFSAKNESSDFELWVYDGVNVPEMLADINPNGGSNPYNFYAYNGKLYFTADDGENGNEVWVYDGENPPQMLANINPNGHAYPQGYIEFNGNLYFFANDGINGSELWMYNGVDEPSLVADINPTGSSVWGQQIIYNNKLYFSANADGSYKLYQYDGVNSPSMVAGSPYANAYNFFIFDGWLYFESSWGELWRYNGADNPELAIKYSDESGANFAGVAVFDNEFYFGKVLPGYSTKFYKCDLGLNLTEISNLGNEDYSAIQGITRIGNSVFFCGSDNTHGYELWMYDLENPPVMFDLHSRNDDSSPAYLTVFDDKLWLRAYNNEANLWFVDNSNTAQQFDGYSNLFPEEFTPFDGNLLFSGQASAGEYKLMFYDGTSTLGQIDLPSPNYRPKGLYSYNEKLYFSHYEPATGWEPYVYDGSTISMVADIYPGANHSDPRNFFEFNNLLIFSAISAATGFELWAYDGENPPYLVADINEGSNSSSPAGFCEFNGKLYFRATDFTPTGDKQHGFELFVYDKENDPYVVFDICPGTCYSNPSDLTVFDNKLYFSASDGINGYELWVYDGENDPDLMFNIVDGPVGESPSDLKVINNALYFSAYTNANGAETWVYDGVEQPKLYAELNEGYIDSDPYEYTFFNNRIYFGALSSSVGQELFSMCPYSVAYIDETACESFEFFGETLSESGTFEHIEQNAYGCNEVTILNLTINAVTFEIEEVEGTITVTASEATYQWVDCNTAFSLIDGATEATFTPSVSGSYAVEVTQNGCTKTSDCIEVTVTGIETIAETLSIYPNPTTGIITVICSNLPINFKVIVKNLIGQRVTEQQNSNRIDMSLLPNGMYIVEVVGNGKTYKSKVVKQ